MAALSGRRGASGPGDGDIECSRMFTLTMWLFRADWQAVSGPFPNDFKQPGARVATASQADEILFWKKFLWARSYAGGVWLDVEPAALFEALAA